MLPSSCRAGTGLLVALALIVCDGSSAFAAKVKMVFPGPATTFSLPLYVAQKEQWLGDLEVEEVVVTGDSNAMRVLLSGNADIALVGTLNVLASIHAGAKVRAVHSWRAHRRLQPGAGYRQGEQARRPHRKNLCLVGAWRAA